VHAPKYRPGIECGHTDGLTPSAEGSPIRFIRTPGRGRATALGVSRPHRTFVAKSVLLIVQCGREIRLNGGITVVPRIGAPTGAANPWSAIGIEGVCGEQFFTLSCGNIASY
jgi:hypothetical protein